MGTSQQPLAYVSIATAHSLGECIRLQMLLDRTQLPYRLQGDKLYGLYGDAALGLAGPIQFLIPSHLQDEAADSLQAIFDVDTALVPTTCPACEAHVPRAQADCPSCGLFLG